MEVGSFLLLRGFRDWTRLVKQLLYPLSHPSSPQKFKSVGESRNFHKNILPNELILQFIQLSVAWLYFDLLNCLVDSNFSPLSFTFYNEFWSRNSICRFRGYSVSSPNWNQVQQPKHHFIISNVESCKSVKLPLHSEDPGNCTYNGFTKGGGGLWFSEAHRGQGTSLWVSNTGSFGLLWDPDPPFFICSPLTAAATPTLQYCSLRC